MADKKNYNSGYGDQLPPYQVTARYDKYGQPPMDYFAPGAYPQPGAAAYYPAPHQGASSNVYINTSYDATAPSYGTPATPVYTQETVFEQGDVPRTCVADSEPSVRAAFLRKVYLILTTQLALTVGVSCLFLFVEDVKTWVQANYWLVWVSIIPSLIVLIALMCLRKKSPINFILLAVFTLLEAYMIGVIVTFYDSDIVALAFFVTMVIFITLTAFTFQTRIDLSGFAPYVMAALLVLIMMSFIGIFWWNDVYEIIWCSLGVLVFCFLILFDTSLILKRLSPEEYIEAAVSLYLDIINLFLYLLRLINVANR